MNIEISNLSVLVTPFGIHEAIRKGGANVWHNNHEDEATQPRLNNMLRNLFVDESHQDTILESIDVVMMTEPDFIDFDDFDNYCAGIFEDWDGDLAELKTRVNAFAATYMANHLAKELLARVYNEEFEDVKFTLEYWYSLTPPFAPLWNKSGDLGVETNIYQYTMSNFCYAEVECQGSLAAIEKITNEINLADEETKGGYGTYLGTEDEHDDCLFDVALMDVEVKSDEIPVIGVLRFSHTTKWRPNLQLLADFCKRHGVTAKVEYQEGHSLMGNAEIFADGTFIDNRMPEGLLDLITHDKETDRYQFNGAGIQYDSWEECVEDNVDLYNTIFNGDGCFDFMNALEHAPRHIQVIIDEHVKSPLIGYQTVGFLAAELAKNGWTILAKHHDGGLYEVYRLRPIHSDVYESLLLTYSTTNQTK